MIDFLDLKLEKKYQLSTIKLLRIEIFLINLYTHIHRYKFIFVLRIESLSSRMI